MATRITFGTDGWRAVMAREFTFDNVRRVAVAVARYVTAKGVADRGMIVGYDARFLSEHFAAEIARVLMDRGLSVVVVNRDVPTPVVVSSIRTRGAGGAVMLTASHNPPEYNGIKFIPQECHPALPEVTDAIEAAIEDTPPVLSTESERRPVEYFDPRPAYMAALRNVVDMDRIRAAKLRVVVDPLYASGRGFLDEAAREAGCEVELIHGERNPLFGGSLPDPNPENLRELSRRVVATRAHLGMATDGDADRFGIVDPSGEYLNPNQVISLVFWHLIQNRGRRDGAVVRTVATTHRIDAIAERYGFRVVETAVGFKWVGSQMVANDAILGGEESGGLTVERHIPEKDGIVANLMMAELIATTGRTPKEILAEIDAEVGPFFSRRVDIHLTPETKDALMASLVERPIQAVDGQPIVTRTRVDGEKCVLADKSWFLIRPSGTEPLVRCYMESRSEQGLAQLERFVRSEAESRARL